MMTANKADQYAMPAFLDAIRLEIDKEMMRTIAELEQRGPEREHPLINRVYRWMRHYLESSGKRMHGIAVVLAYRACADEVDSHVIPIAAALQLYHHHTLVHDDIYDEDTARRGWPTSHLAFASLFNGNANTQIPESRLFANESLRRGAIAAFAYGKICRALAGHMILRSSFQEDARLDVGAMLDWHDLYDNAAQLKDVHHEGEAMPDPQSCLDNAWLKTGRLFEICAYAGARLGNGSKNQIEALQIWSGQAALAYQIQDDLEDLNTDSEKGQGRGIGTDLLRCKPTYLYATAKTLATGVDKDSLLSWQRGEKTGLSTPDIIDILNRCGAVDACKLEITRCIERACAALNGAQPAFSKKSCTDMVEFAHYFISAAYWRRRIISDETRSAALMD